MTRRIALRLLLTGASTGASTPAARAAGAVVSIDNFAFVPAEITVSAGTMVTWTNRDDIPHTVADADHPKDTRSAALDTGDSYSRTFAAPGVYRYFCSLHPHMQGIVIVR